MSLHRFLAASLAALIAAVPTHAIAADAVADTIAGWCKQDVDPRLEQLSALLDEAACEAAEAVPVDSRVRTRVLRSPVFEGPREFGLPSGIRTDVDVSWMFAPLVEIDETPKPSFFWSQYQGFKEAVEAYNAGAGEAGEYLADTQYDLGPEWLKNIYRAGGKTGVEVVAGVIAVGPNLILTPEAVWQTPDVASNGLAKIEVGISTRQHELVLEGLGEVCGAVGTLAAVAIPFAKGIGSARGPISLKPTAPRPIPSAGALSLVEPPKPLRFTQNTASPEFSGGGKFKGMTIGEVAQKLYDKKLNQDDVPVTVVERDGVRLIETTRSALALRRAGIPESQWKIIDATGDPAIEARVDLHLKKNGLTNAGTETLRITKADEGSAASSLK